MEILIVSVTYRPVIGIDGWVVACAGLTVRVNRSSKDRMQAVPPVAPKFHLYNLA